MGKHRFINLSPEQNVLSAVCLLDRNVVLSTKFQPDGTHLFPMNIGIVHRWLHFPANMFVSFLIVLFLNFQALGLWGQERDTVIINWTELDQGLSYCEIDAPEKSIVNDSKLTLVRIDPLQFEFNFLTATEFGEKSRTAEQWSNEFDQEVVINAGMYNFKKNHPNKGYLRNFEHLNNPSLNGYYNAMMVSHPKDTLQKSFQIVDLTCDPWDSIKNGYFSYCQGMRMMDCEGNPMAFSKRPDQKCSMILISSDINGIIYIVFTRSPYTHKAMIKFLKGFPLGLRQTVYLEGGPEASLYIKTRDRVISKFGCYVSKTWENDDGDQFREIPNIIGMKRK